MITTTLTANGVAEIVIDHPPVNALPVAGWFELAEAVRAAGRDPQVRVVVLRAGGRGFSAGVDIKELQADSGFTALVGANRGCFAAFAAVYECAVPVIAAVHGFCLGGGIGLVGNADVIVASEDATFGLPEVDRGALGAATHLSRLVPQHKARAMMYTSATATAAELHAYGSVLRVVPLAELRDAALAVAAQIAAKDPAVIRLAKEAFNGIDPWDVNRSYRYEQGFTFELNLSGVSDRLRESFGQDREDGAAHA
jgi:enoyl-CoA hydratase